MNSDDLPQHAIAVIAMAGRFPGASDFEALWQTMLEQREHITRFAPGDLEDHFSPAERAQPNYVAARPIVEGADLFDADAFGMQPREAALTDPQHRIFLEIAWEALERANCDPSRHPGAIGVFAGASMPTYLMGQVLKDRAHVQRFISDYQVGSYQELLGALPDALATRVAYKLGLTGPAMTIQTACSTSLLCVAQACQSLLLGQCDVALAGGVSITFPQRRGYFHLEGGMVSPDGRCRPFDAGAQGTVFGSGAGVVVLKRLEDALAEGDRIRAVIRGLGVNNDGAAKAGFTAPSVQGQADAIAAALGFAGLEANDIGYIEAHGTGTPLGDPIEFEGLSRAFAGAQPAECALGSAKANIGHLDAAAGVVGLMRAIKAVESGIVPPLTNFERPNPRIEMEGSPFFAPRAPQPWVKAGPRRAGVSSFGVGGTNVHLVVEEAPAIAIPSPKGEGAVSILPVSARSAEALKAACVQLAEFLSREPAQDLREVAATLQQGRRAFQFRAAVAAQTAAEAAALLRNCPVAECRGEPPVVFLFPGQGAQYPDMGRGLYEHEPTFRAIIDRGAAVLGPSLELDIREALFSGTAQTEEEAAHPIRATVLAQPALYLVEYGVAQLLLERGLKPHAMVGHSVGEFVAAALAGVFSFEDGLRLIAARARLMQSQPGGGMLSVRMSADQLEPMLRAAGLDLAAINAPELCVAAGPHEALRVLAAELEQAGVPAKLLHTSHAFHSRGMDAVTGPLEAEARKLKLSPPSLPYASCVTGRMITPEEACDPAYWARHARAPVRFADALAAAAGSGAALLEVGPGRALGALSAQILPRGRAAAIASTLPDHAREVPDQAAMAQALARLWTIGAAPPWPAPEAGGRRASLPTYPFQKKRHWIDAAPSASVPESRPPAPQIAQTAPQLAPVAEPVPAEELVAMHPSEAFVPEVLALLGDLAGRAFEPADAEASFLELGFDSLALGQVAQKLKAAYGVKITFRQLMGEFPTVGALCAHLATTAKPKQAAFAPAAPPASALAPMDLAAVAAQLQALQAQVQALQTGASPPSNTGASARRLVQLPEVEDVNPRFRSGAAQAGGALSLEQKAFIGDFTRRFTAKTGKSKAYTGAHRRHLADPRAAAGFRQEWKEIVYPLVAARSKGSKIWDLDGNCYVDLVNGYGQTAFGHAPDFVTDAVAAQLREGFAIGPQSPLAGEVAALISEMTGMERVTFCNTGSEAVMAAMRVARAVTGRSRVAVFANDYHGQFDEVLVKSGRNGAAAPFAPGIPPEAVANMAVLPYGAPESLAWIEANAEEIAAVIVEPVQSRHPNLRPVEFLHALRALTAKQEIALVFDEVVTGFRTHSAGAQHLFGVRADMATYGKVLGGGMPIGVLAGSGAFMDALDGGYWAYGDESFPETAPTFFAGTFVRHPTALAAAKAVLLHLKQEGPELQERLDKTTAGLVARVNAQFADRGIALAAEHFSSWFYLSVGAADRLGGLFYPLVRYHGVNIQEGYPCFLTTAHDAADLDLIVDAVGKALDELQAVGAFPAAPGQSVGRSQPARLPLTEPQQEVWLAAQLSDAASCAFNESLTIRFEGALDEAALLASLDGLVRRHDALRMRFAPSGEWQTPVEEQSWPLQRNDLAGPDAEQLLAQVIEREAATPFNLVADPPIRGVLARLGQEQFALVLTAHHIICDGWSFNVLVEELAQLYSAHIQGAEAALAPALPFSAYAQREAGRGISAETEQFWRDLYRDAPEPLSLPVDRPRPPRKSFAGSTLTASFDAALRDRAKKAAAAQGASLFAILLATLQAALGRLAANDDVVVATPTAGQAALEDETLVGHAVNFLALRQRFDARASFKAHLAAVKAHALEAFEHGDLTFGSLVRLLGVRRDPSQLPLTSVQFNLERVGEWATFAGLQTTLLPNPKRFVNFDLFFNVIEGAGGLRIDCDYNTDIFDKDTVNRFIGIWRRVLEGAIAAPDCAIADLSLLQESELAQVRAFGRGPQRPLPAKFVHHLIEEQAVRTPEALAVVAGEARLTYAELDARAEYWSRRIRHTCAPGERVAVALERSVDLPAALLGCWKAGCAYVPLDPGHPEARLRQTMQTARVAALICDDPKLGALAPAGAVAIRRDQSQTLELAPKPRTEDRDPAQAPAYVIFTSGSTGVPKGVEVSHRALLNLLTAMAEQFQLNGKDRLVAVTTVSFDIAALELFAPLTVGGEIVIASRDEVRAGFDLLELIERTAPTLVQATPSLWRILLEAGFQPRPNLKMLCGGEPLPRDLADKLAGGPLWNMYGPTETTVWSTCGRVKAGPVSIGEPILNTDVVILDPWGGLLPPGVPGRLHIGGAGLATGYFDRPDLTEAAFRELATPWGVQRLYNTGDLAVLRPDGALMVLGRADQQIKLRGFRIELEEIETVLRAQPGVQACAVAVRPGPNGEPRLAGYVVGEAAPDFAALASALERALPDYMAPTAWVALQALPLTGNGKLDRKALPDPVAGVRTGARGGAPSTQLEREIAEVWLDVLGLEEIGVEEDLFALGADSLQLFRIAARLMRAGRSASVRDILEAPSIAGLAARLESETSAPLTSKGPSLRDYLGGAKRRGAG